MKWREVGWDTGCCIGTGTWFHMCTGIHIHGCIVKMCRLMGTHMKRYIVTMVYAGGAHVYSYTVHRHGGGQVHSFMCTQA